MPRPLSGGRRILLEWLLIAILATAALVTAVSTDLLRRADNLVYDRLSWLRQQPARDDIIIIAIDDESISRLGRFPWPRQVHARLLNRLERAKPRAILYDVLFVEAGPGDSELTAAVGRTRPILPLFMEIPGRKGQPVTIVPPIDGLRQAGAEIGHANLSPDEEGIVRRVYLVEGTVGQLLPHVAALTACEAAQVACLLPTTGTGGEGHVRLKPYLIPYAGGRQHFRTVPFSAVLGGGVPDAFFRDRIVLVGATATGHSDTYATPMGERETLMPGVEVNANIVQGLISGRALSLAPAWVRYLLVLAPLWLLLAGFLIARPRFNFLLGLLLGSGVILASVAAFLLAGVWASPLTAIAGLVLVYPTWAWRRLEATSAYMREELERFRRDPDVLVDTAPPAADMIQNDIELLRGAIGRARDLQHFVSDTLKGLPDASIVVGTGGRIRMMNERAVSLLGDGEGQHFSWVVERLTNRQIAVSEQEPGSNSLPPEIVDTAGRVFNVRWSPISDRKGGLGAWVLRLADITDLRTATRQREEALQLLTHDMRSPQASIIATLSQARGTVDGGLARRIENYARRTLELADGYVQLARAEAQPLTFDHVNFCDVVLDAVDDLWPLSSARPIHVDAEGCEGEILVRADRGLLTRAVINLVGNAIKYGPAASQVRCKLERIGPAAVFTVCDEGPGLSEDQIGHLFQPFRQVGKSIVEGVGLGLAFVSSVAARHGGSVSCRSAPGEGSCFELRLPVVEGEPVS